MFQKHPWLWVVVAHIVIIGVLTTVYVISKKYQQQEVPLIQTHGN